jgi:hypothetical protein
MTTPEQLRALVDYLQARVEPTSPGSREVVFDVPSVEEVVSDGLDGDTYRALTAASWWSEMVDDVRETPDFAAPEEPAEVVLGYARDVVEEYVRKRARIED